MADRILFVDDEQAVPDSYRRILYGKFQIDIANGAPMGLTAVKEKGPYSVVISDMRMPGMNGAEFLGLVRQSAPDTVRMLLTGYTDLEVAIEAVNRGNIFRFLTKPCEPEGLVVAIAAGLEQYRLITSERELLEKSFMGSIKVLTEVLSAASPEAFGRSVRIANYVRRMMAKLPLHSARCFDAAATLSQLGCITLEFALIHKAYAGEKLTAEDQERFDAHLRAAVELLKNIPRLEPISWLIGQQLQHHVAELRSEYPGISSAELKRGASMLQLAAAFEQLSVRKIPKSEVISEL
jgi:response regulator RpfG family c-di-GMP phosphodiesterase